MYPLIVKLLSYQNTKAKQWIDGRKKLLKKIQLDLSVCSKDKIWIHVASFGEYEQVKPLIFRLKEFSHLTIVLTVFSPSGYQIAIDEGIVDYVFYLPMDGKKRAESFLKIVNPILIIFVKYEFWYYYLITAKRMGISSILISSVFRKRQLFFKWYGHEYRKVLNSFTWLFVQDIRSAAILRKIGLKEKIVIAGDTRFDTVINNQLNFIKQPVVEKFINNRYTIVAGSVWASDLLAIKKITRQHPQILLIVVPHQVNKGEIDICKESFPDSILYSDLRDADNDTMTVLTNKNTLIIDTLGILKYLYYYGNLCYVGGGFDSMGVHNVLEPAVYGKPICIGPHYQDYLEAVQLVKMNGIVVCHTVEELTKILEELISAPKRAQLIGDQALNYVNSQQSSIIIIMEYIQYLVGSSA